jgi:hypothetical protein
MYKQIIPAVRWDGFVSNRMSYIIPLRDWYDIIVLNVHAPTEDEMDNVNDSCYEYIVPTSKH